VHFLYHAVSSRRKEKRNKNHHSFCLSPVTPGLVPGKLLRGLPLSLLPVTSTGSEPSRRETQEAACSPAAGNCENSRAAGSGRSHQVPNPVLNRAVKDGPLKLF